MEKHDNAGCLETDGFSRYHEYAEKVCHKCGATFCFGCCHATNVHEGGKYTPDFMECPVCLHDWYQE